MIYRQRHQAFSGFVWIIFMASALPLFAGLPSPDAEFIGFSGVSIDHLGKTPLNACTIASKMEKYSRSLTDTTLQLVAPEIKDSCAPFPLVLQILGADNASVSWTSGDTTRSLTITTYGSYVARVQAPGVDTLLKYTIEEVSDNRCCKPMMPNAFTPNGDGTNDTFGPTIKGCKVLFLEMSVYGRWGELYFFAEKPTDRWTGMTLNGTDAPMDVYVYKIRYQLEGEAEKQMQGDVTLIR
jgi:gliding motility-associated-like protein